MNSRPPPAVIRAQRKKILRWVGMTLSAGMVLVVLTTTALIIRSEAKYDEATCPFVQISERPFSGGKVVEENRECVEPVAERQYLVVREGKPTLALAQRRLDRDRFAPNRFRWTLEEDPNQLVVLKIFVDGQLTSESHEADVVKR